MKKLQILLLAGLLLLLSAGQALAFSDMAAYESEIQQEVNQLAELGILNGYDDGTFRPEAAITRAEFAQVMVKALQSQEQGSAGRALPLISFSDVRAGDWYYNSVAAAVGRGLLQGDAEGTFRPNEPVSLAEALTVTLRCLGYDELPGAWPDNYINKALELGLLGNPNADCSQPCLRYQAAGLISAVLYLTGEEQEENQPAAPQTVQDYGVVTGLSGESITIYSLEHGHHTYKLAADCDWQSSRSECGTGRLVWFELNQEEQVQAVSRQQVQTHKQREAELSGGKIKLNGKNYAFNGDAAVLLLNSAGGVNRVSLEKLLESSYVADLRSSSYSAPLQYVLAEEEVLALLIGDYQGQSDLRFGFVEYAGLGADGDIVHFYGEDQDYLWHYTGKGQEERPRENVLYAYRYSADGVEGYEVDVSQEQIRQQGQGEVIRSAGDICFTEEGHSFIVNEDTVIIRAYCNSNGEIYNAEYEDAVYAGDRVRVRWTTKSGSNYTGIEAAYIIILDIS